LQGAIPGLSLCCLKFCACLRFSTDRFFFGKEFFRTNINAHLLLVLAQLVVFFLYMTRHPWIITYKGKFCPQDHQLNNLCILFSHHQQLPRLPRLPIPILYIIKSNHHWPFTPFIYGPNPIFLWWIHVNCIRQFPAE
jgi:hypothetical protein